MGAKRILMLVGDFLLIQADRVQQPVTGDIVSGLELADGGGFETFVVGL